MPYVNVLLIFFLSSASCATIIRLRYLTLYNNQAEFMYSAGPIGLWSVIEEGIGIIAGSLPALRPLLSLSVFGGTRNGTLPSKDHGNLEAWREESHAADNDEGNDIMTLDTRSARAGADSDGESQTKILKETSVVISSGPSNPAAAEQWKRSRVNEWDEARN